MAEWRKAAVAVVVRLIVGVSVVKLRVVGNTVVASII